MGSQKGEPEVTKNEVLSSARIILGSLWPDTHVETTRRPKDPRYVLLELID